MQGMDIPTLYSGMTDAERRAWIDTIHARTQISRKYIYQLAIGFQGRRGSARVVAKIAEADPRVTLEAQFCVSAA